MRAIAWLAVVCVCGPLACLGSDRPVANSGIAGLNRKQLNQQNNVSSVVPLTQLPVAETEDLRLPLHFQADLDGEQSLPENAVVAGRDPVHVKVGQPVLFQFGYTVVPSMIVSQYKMAINGVDIPNPEVVSPKNQAPGYCRTILVYRPKSKGEHQVVITKVFSDFSNEETWTVIASE